MPKKTTYTGEDLRRDKKKLGISWRKFADDLGFKSERIMYMYASGQWPIPKFIARSIKAMLLTTIFQPRTEKQKKGPGRPMVN